MKGSRNGSPSFIKIPLMPKKQSGKFLIIYNNSSKLYVGKYNFSRKLYTEGSY